MHILGRGNAMKTQSTYYAVIIPGEYKEGRQHIFPVMTEDGMLCLWRNEHGARRVAAEQFQREKATISPMGKQEALDLMRWAKNDQGNKKYAFLDEREIMSYDDLYGDDDISKIEILKK